MNQWNKKQIKKWPSPTPVRVSGRSIVIARVLALVLCHGDVARGVGLHITLVHFPSTSGGSLLSLEHATVIPLSSNPSPLQKKVSLSTSLYTILPVVHVSASRDSVVSIFFKMIVLQFCTEMHIFVFRVLSAFHVKVYHAVFSRCRHHPHVYTRKKKRESEAASGETLKSSSFTGEKKENRRKEK